MKALPKNLEENFLTQPSHQGRPQKFLLTTFKSAATSVAGPHFEKLPSTSEVGLKNRKVQVDADRMKHAEEEEEKFGQFYKSLLKSASSDLLNIGQRLVVLDSKHYSLETTEITDDKHSKVQNSKGSTAYPEYSSDKAWNSQFKCKNSRKVEQKPIPVQERVEIFENLNSNPSTNVVPNYCIDRSTSKVWKTTLDYQKVPYVHNNMSGSNRSSVSRVVKSPTPNLRPPPPFTPPPNIPVSPVGSKRNNISPFQTSNGSALTSNSNGNNSGNNRRPIEKIEDERISIFGEPGRLRSPTPNSMKNNTNVNGTCSSDLG